MLIVVIIVLAICVSSLYFRVNSLERRESVSHRIDRRMLYALIFALYDKRKTDIDERILDIADLEEAVRVINGEKRPEKDTPIEDLSYILGDEYAAWKKAIASRE